MLDFREARADSTTDLSVSAPYRHIPRCFQLATAKGSSREQFVKCTTRAGTPQQVPTHIPTPTPPTRLLTKSSTSLGAQHKPTSRLDVRPHISFLPAYHAHSIILTTNRLRARPDIPPRLPRLPRPPLLNSPNPLPSNNPRIRRPPRQDLAPLRPQQQRSERGRGG